MVQMMFNVSDTIYRPYSKIATDLIFFCMHINRPLLPRFGVKIILNLLHDNEVIRANLYAYKRTLNRRPFMFSVRKNVYKRSKSHRSWNIGSTVAGTHMPFTSAAQFDSCSFHSYQRLKQFYLGHIWEEGL